VLFDIRRFRLRPGQIPVRTNRRASSVVLFVLLFSNAITDGSELGIRVPDGFTVTQFATDELAHDIYSMTVNADGRVVVAGAGYIRTLVDRDDDGQADEAIEFSDRPERGAQGLLFVGRKLFCTGDNSVWLFEDRDGDGRADDQGHRLLELKNPEHGAHGLIQGPDGDIYLICGNDANVRPELNTSQRSAITQPQSGALLRFTQDAADCEILAHGFRNPYDVEFTAEGHVVTVDSDGERDHHLPWYVPTRLFLVEQGAHHGWVNNGWTLSWSRPASFYDNVAPHATFGRGSPTGITTYRHRAFHNRYHDGVFTCCWTLGRVYFTPASMLGWNQQHQASPRASVNTGTTEPEIFLQTIGTQGFAPVDIAVGQRGELYVAIGGRGTQGGVFRITARDVPPWSMPANRLEAVLQAPQPLSSWSRHAWQPLARELGSQPFIHVALDSERTDAERIRAIEVLTQEFGGIPHVAQAALAATESELVRARLAWSLGCHPTSSIDTLCLLAADAHPPVVAAALRACIGRDDLGSQCDELLGRLQPDVYRVDRQVRHQLVCLLIDQNISPQRIHVLADPLLTARVALERGEPVDLDSIIEQLETSASTWRTLEAIRLLQRSVGLIQVQQSSDEGLVGYSVAEPRQPASDWTSARIARLASRFPSDVDAEATRELARLLGLLRADVESLTEALLRQCRDDSPVEQDLHYLMVLAHLPATGQTPNGTKRSLETAEILLRLPVKMRRDNQLSSRNWPSRVSAMIEMLQRRDTGLSRAIANHPQLGADDHAMHVLCLPEPDRLRAAERLVDRFVERDDGVWDETMLEVVELLEPQRQRVLLREWIAHSSIPALALDRLASLPGSPEAIDRQLFREGLLSTRTDTVIRSANALARMPSGNASPDDWLAAMRALRRHVSPDTSREAWKSITALLAHWAGDTPVGTAITPLEDTAEARQHTVAAWTARASKTSPELSAQLAADTVAPVAWLPRLARVQWSHGDAERGAGEFRRRQCAACHEGNRRLGPELTAVAKRLSRDDLFTSIVDPQRDVAPTYYTQRVVTADGRSFQGLIVYESPNGTLLQTGPQEVVRVDVPIATRSEVRQSLMPTGLLDDATDQDLADLYAYLRQLTAR
jgi:putative heme-binding domain-containing protein